MEERLKIIRKRRDLAPLTSPEWLLYNSELRYMQACKNDPADLKARLWRHIYQNNLEGMKNKKIGHWRILPPVDPLPGFDAMTSTILVHRGVTSNAERFIQAPLEDLVLEMDEIEYATSLILRALLKKVPITIYGDYDADGITGTALLVEALQRLGAKVDYYINNRRKGYAVDEAGIREIAGRGVPRLIITVDNGCTAYEAIEKARKMRMAIIVTDHHDMPQRPHAHACVHPHTFNTALCGAGTAFKLVHYLYNKLNRKDMFDFLDLAAIGTVADLVPLKGENRIIVKNGLQLLNKCPRPAIQALSQKLYLRHINAGSIAFKIAPLLNSISRLNLDAENAVKFLLARDLGEASFWASRFAELNNERRALVEEEFKMADAQVDSGEKIIVVKGPFTTGITGILAGRLREKYNRPAIVLAEDGEYLKGSARSGKEFNIKEALDGFPRFKSFGGHAAAAGLALQQKDLPEFKEFLGTAARGIELQEAVLEADAELENLDRETAEGIERLEPYGEGFPTPLFVYNTQVRKVEIINNHVKINGCCMIWNAREDFQKDNPQEIALLGTPVISDYSHEVEFMVKDWKSVG